MDEYEEKRRLARRRMALVSFWFLIASGVAILAILLFHHQRAEVAQALQTASFVVGSLMAMPTAIVLGYLGVSVAEQIFKKG